VDVRSITLAPNEPVRQQIPFRFFMLLETGAPLEVRFLAAASLSKTGEVGRAVEAGYKKWPLNPADERERWGGYELVSTVLQTVRVGVSESQADYARLVQVFELELAADFATQDDEAVTTTAAEVIAANADRTKLIVQHVGGAGVVRLGDDQITDTRGGQLRPNGAYTVHAKGALYARTESGTATLAFLEEVK
jgi:hypothetical protein